MIGLLMSLLLIAAPAANALTTSPHSLRIEDSKEGNVLLGSDQAVIERGELFKNVVVAWGKLDVSGEVDKVIVLSGSVKFRAGSKLKESLVVMGGSFEVESGADVPSEKIVAQIPGPVWRAVRSAAGLWHDNMDWVTTAAYGLVTSLVLWLVGLAGFAIFPALQAATEGSLSAHWPKNLVLGVLGAVGACATGVLLVISIIGILLLPFYLLFLAGAYLVSYLAAALWAGHRLLPPRRGRRLNPGGFLLGVLALKFLSLVPVLGAAIPVWILWTLAWGALVRASARLWK